GRGECPGLSQSRPLTRRNPHGTPARNSPHHPERQPTHMANSDPASPGTLEPAGPRRRRTRALLVFAALAGLCSALLVAEASTHPEAAPKALSQGTTTLNIAE